MRKKVLGEIVGLIMIAFHFGIIYYIITSYRQDKFLPDQMRTTLGIIVPMFGIYIGTIIKSFISNQSNKARGVKVRFTYTIICFLIPIFYCSFVLSIILDQTSQIRNQSFEDFVSQLTIAETVFAAFTGFIISDLYGENLSDRIGSTENIDNPSNPTKPTNKSPKQE